MYRQSSKPPNRYGRKSGQVSDSVLHILYFSSVLRIRIHWIRIRIQPVAEPGSGSGSRPRFLHEKMLKIIYNWKHFSSKTVIYVFLNLYKERSGSSNVKFLHFYLFCGTLLAWLNLDPIRIRNMLLTAERWVKFYRKMPIVHGRYRTLV